MTRSRTPLVRFGRLPLLCLLALAVVTTDCGRAPDEDASREPAVRVAPGIHGADLAAATARHLDVMPLPASARDVGDQVHAFYEARRRRPAWVDTDGPTGRASVVLDLLRRAGRHGLVPADYGLEAVTTLRDDLCGLRRETGADDVRADRLAALEVQLTASLLAFGRDVALGRVTPDVFSSQWRSERAVPDLAGSLGEVLRRAEAGPTGLDLDGWVDAISPRHPEYRALRRLLMALRDQAGFPHETFPAGREILQTLELNLDRWRWLPDDLGARHVLVNIPAYHLYVREAGQPVLDMRVIVGKAGVNETPIFSSAFTTIVFSPFWYIPDTIAVDETIPTCVRDPDYLDRVGIEVLRVGPGGTTTLVDPASIEWRDRAAWSGLVLRQKPGPTNALGHVKFQFPNPYSVYLHDTPADALFDLSGRALSHGCIRLDEAADLAAYLLRDRPEWSAARIASAMRAGSPHTVPLRDRVPLHVVYFTAWPDGQGGVRRFDDVYGLDAAQLASWRDEDGRE